MLDIEYEQWAFDYGRDLVIPSSDPKEVGQFIGELLWYLEQETQHAGAQAIDYEKILAGPRVQVSSTAHLEPRGVAASFRRAQVRKLFEKIPTTPLDAWVRVRMLRTWKPHEGVWATMTVNEAADDLGRDRKTIMRWTDEVDEAICSELDKREWKL